MIQMKDNGTYHEAIKVFAGGAVQQEIIKIWSTDADDWVYEATDETSGTLPLTFHADGSALVDYQIFGNTGGVGDRTVNYFDYTQLIRGYIYDSNGQMILNPDEGSRWRYAAIPFIQVTPGATYLRTRNLTPIGNTVNYYDSEKNFIAQATPGTGVPFTVPNNCYFITYVVSTDGGTEKYMLTEGTTPPASYEPYGYKLDMGISDGSVGQLFNEIYPHIDATARYIALHVGEGSFTLSTNMPLTPQQAANLFLLAGNVTTGASTSTNGVYNVRSWSVTAINGYITIAYREYSGVDPRDYHVMLNKGSTPLPYQPYFDSIAPLYIGDDPLGEDEYVNYAEQKVYRRTVNLFNKDAALDGYEIVNNGYNRNENWCVSDFIPVESDTLYKSKNSGGAALSFTDKSSQPTRLNGSLSSIGVTTLPETKFIKINCQISQKASCIVAKSNDLPETYIPYLQPTDPPVALPALPTCEGATVVDYAGSGTAPSSVYMKYKKGW